MLKILYLGELIGLQTVKQVEKNLSTIIKENNINFTIANADGASDGYGLLKNTAYALHNAGINVLTTGDQVFNKKDAGELLKSYFVIRPYNLPNSLGGKGVSFFKINDKVSIGIINILGRTNFNKIFPSDPFFSINKSLEKLQEITPNIIVDFHGGATSEIQAMQWYLAGRVTAIIGSHLKILTSDNRIINNKTAVITGSGYSGGLWSIGGFTPDIEIKKIKHGQFIYSKIVKENITLQGVILEINEENGEAKSIDLFVKKIS